MDWPSLTLMVWCVVAWRGLGWALTLTAPEMQAGQHVYCDWELSIIAVTSVLFVITNFNAARD